MWEAMMPWIRWILYALGLAGAGMVGWFAKAVMVALRRRPHLSRLREADGGWWLSDDGQRALELETDMAQGDPSEPWPEPWDVGRFWLTAAPAVWPVIRLRRGRRRSGRV